MKIQLGKVTICSRNRLRKKLLEAMTNGTKEKQPVEYGYVLGAYDSHIFGICIYRNSSKFL